MPFFVLLFWAFLFFVFCGIGSLIFRTMRCAYFSQDILYSFWAGWAFVLFFLQIWHLFLPINNFCFLSVVGMALWGIYRNWNWFKSSTVMLFEGSSFTLSGVIWIFASLGIAFNASHPYFTHDNGLYHFNVIAWAKAFGDVPGLANLHGRLGFNSAYHLYAAFLQVHPVIPKSHHFAGGLLLWVLLSQIILSFPRIWDASKQLSWRDLFYILIFPVIYWQSMVQDFSNPSTILPIYVIGVVIAGLFLQLLQRPEEKFYLLFMIGILATAALIVKLSSVVLAFSFLSLAVFSCLDDQSSRADQKKWFFSTAMVVLIGLVPFLIRNAVTSGYLLYPFPFGAIPVEWRVPRASVLSNYNWIKSWARLPFVHWNVVLQNWDWVKPWMMAHRGDDRFRFPLLTGIIGVMVFTFLRIPRIIERKFWLIFIPPLLATAAWFFSAPDLRFLGPSLWIISCGIFLLVLMPLSIQKLQSTLRIYICFIVPASFILSFPVSLSGSRGFFTEESFSRFYQDIPKAKLETFVTDAGLVLYVPSQESGGSQCWDSPLLCTPYPHRSLALRKKNDLGGGFIVLGRDENDATVGIR